MSYLGPQMYEWYVFALYHIGSIFLLEPPPLSCYDEGAARCFLLGAQRFWSLAGMAWGLVSGAT